MTLERASEAQIAVLLDVELIEILDEMARERGISRSALLRGILHDYLGVGKSDEEPQLELDVEKLSPTDILLASTSRYRWLRLMLIEIYPEVSSVLEKRCSYCGRRFRARRYLARHIARGRGPCPRIYSARIEEVKKIYSEFVSLVKRETMLKGEERVEIYVLPNLACPPGRRCGEKVFRDLGEAIKYFVSRVVRKRARKKILSALRR